jgi:hypothetical protein
MPTVKLQAGKVILKNGKVSCTCCGCCMYPASALEDATLTWHDLPETLYDPIEVRTFTRVEPYEDGGATIYYTAPDIAGEPQTIYIDESASPWEWNSGTIPSAGGPCLITGDGNYTPGDDAIEDQFESIYVISFEDGVFLNFSPWGTGIINGFDLTPLQGATLQRESLCTWVSEDISAPDIVSEAFGGYTITGIKLRATLSYLSGSNLWHIDVEGVSTGGSFPAADVSGPTGGVGRASKRPDGSAPDADDNEYDAIPTPPVGLTGNAFIS